MSVKKILVLCLVGALVLTGSVMAVARLAGGEGEEAPSTPAPQAPASPVAPETTETAPGTAPPAAPPAPAPLPSRPAPPNPPAPLPPPANPPPSFVEPPAIKPTIVTPRPGMDNVFPVTWTSAQTLNERSVRIHFESGVAPCSVLDRVEVSYSASAVSITLFEGSDPAFKNAACIMIAQFKAVDVTLTEPLSGRKVVDGSL